MAAHEYKELEGLVKMSISAYPNEDYDDKEVLKTFVVMYNPNTYQQKYKNAYVKPRVTGSTSPLVFTHTEPESIDFDFFFDATGASLSGRSEVADQVKSEGRTDQVIKQFLAMAYQRSGETHQPSFLKLCWGDFEFRGLLEEATVTHKMFNLDGNPLRSEVRCTFRKHTSLREQAAEERKSSPDMTHYRLIKEGDTLHSIAHETYRDASFYMELARVNNLINFRTLKPGSRLILPPVLKS